LSEAHGLTRENIFKTQIYSLAQNKKCAKAAGGTALGVKVCGWVVRYGIEEQSFCRVNALCGKKAFPPA
jgi:hypothetical protein